MPPSEPPIPRLCLVTPATVDPSAFAAVLDGALAAGDVASLIVAAGAASDLAALAEAVVPIAVARGVATLIAGDAAVARRAGADGVHVEGEAALKAAIAAMRPRGIVGAGGAASRHDAMVQGELGPDYVFFGRLDGDDAPDVHERSLDLAAWWAGLFEIPAVLMAGGTLASVAEAAASGAEFIAVRRAVWDHPDGPAAGVRDATRLLRGAEPA